MKDKIKGKDRNTGKNKIDSHNSQLYNNLYKKTIT